MISGMILKRSRSNGEESRKKRVSLVVISSMILRFIAPLASDLARLTSCVKLVDLDSCHHAAQTAFDQVVFRLIERDGADRVNVLRHILPFFREQLDHGRTSRNGATMVPAILLSGTTVSITPARMASLRHPENNATGFILRNGEAAAPLQHARTLGAVVSHAGENRGDGASWESEAPRNGISNRPKDGRRSRADRR